MNLADISDKLCLTETNVVAAAGVLVMKHAFDSDRMKGIVGNLNKMLSKLENRARNAEPSRNAKNLQLATRKSPNFFVRLGFLQKVSLQPLLSSSSFVELCRPRSD